jgi:hypothetical protein
MTLFRLTGSGPGQKGRRPIVEELRYAGAYRVSNGR